MKATPEDVAKLCARTPHAVTFASASMKATPEDVAKVSTNRVYGLIADRPQ